MAIRSLAVDKNDAADLRHGREVHEGAVVGGEFHQPCPMFFTREGANLSLKGSFRGAAAFFDRGGAEFCGGGQDAAGPGLGDDAE